MAVCTKWNNSNFGYCTRWIQGCIQFFVGNLGDTFNENIRTVFIIPILDGLVKQVSQKLLTKLIRPDIDALFFT